MAESRKNIYILTSLQEAECRLVPRTCRVDSCFLNTCVRTTGQISTLHCEMHGLVCMVETSDKRMPP